MALPLPDKHSLDDTLPAANAAFFLPSHYTKPAFLGLTRITYHPSNSL